MAPDEAVPVATLETLDTDTCWDLLSDQHLGRIGCVRGGTALVLPVNARLHKGCVYYRTHTSALVAPHGSSEELCFEVDGRSDRHRLGWSVLLVGTAEIIDVADYPEVAAEVDSWAVGADGVVVRLQPHSISGRQVVRPDGSRLATAPRSVPPPTPVIGGLSRLWRRMRGAP